MKEVGRPVRRKTVLLLALLLLAMAGLAYFFYRWSVAYQNMVQTETELRDHGVTHWLAKELNAANSVRLSMKPLEAPPREVTLDGESRRVLSKAIVDAVGGVGGGKGFVGTMLAPQRIKVLGTPDLNCEVLLVGDSYRHWLIVKWHDHLYVLDLGKDVQELIRRLGFPEF